MLNECATNRPDIHLGLLQSTAQVIVGLRSLPRIDNAEREPSPQIATHTRKAMAGEPRTNQRVRLRLELVLRDEGLTIHRRLELNR